MMEDIIPTILVCQGLRVFQEKGLSVLMFGKFWANQDELVTLEGM